MKNKMIGIINAIYAFIIIYIFCRGTMGNYLAPRMHKYVIFALVFLIISAFIFLISNNKKQKFNYIDIVLIIPVIMIVLSGNGELSLSLAANKSNNFTIPTSESNKSIDNPDDKKDIENNYEEIEKYDFSNVDYDITDEIYEGLIDYLSSENGIKNKGKTIRIRGYAVKKADYLTKGYFALGKYYISCCAADAGLLGFLVKDDLPNVLNEQWYEIEGILEEVTTKFGYNMLAIKPVNIKEIDKNTEELYIYPCYAYGNGKCEELMKYLNY